MDIFQALAEGKRGAVARSRQVARYVLDQPENLPVLISALEMENSVVIAHASHALLTVFLKSPYLLIPFKGRLFDLLMTCEQWEQLEQLSKIVPHLGIGSSQAEALVARLEAVLMTGKSSIARTCALQAIVDMANLDPAFKANANSALSFSIEKGSKAMQARARNLMSL